MTSSRNHWILTLSLAGLLSLVLCTSAELWRRAQAHHATVRDDLDLWALEVARFQRAGKSGLAILGTSRVLFGLDPRVLKRELPHSEPIMLALNGLYPLTSLRMFAQDPQYLGDVFIEIDARGLARYYRNMQLGYVWQAQKGVGPSAAINRRLLSAWQDHAVIANAELGLPALVQRKLFGAPVPPINYVRMWPDRSAALDFSLPGIPLDGLTQNFAAGVLGDYQSNPPPPPDRWIADLADVAADIRALRARGVRVIFFCAKTQGAHLQADLAGYPRELYWDRFAKEIAQANGAYAFYAWDAPAIAALNLPDGSHVDQRDRTALTEAIAALLRETIYRPQTP
jgi:hypothetical protein